mmetsp:Transcript_76183/g.218283  ORF Transcript_76183/g.218283 Transcript_76183/m.218283 type:complete len:228 (+) Transcript_76183:963-1646(+)
MAVSTLCCPHILEFVVAKSLGAGSTTAEFEDEGRDFVEVPCSPPRDVRSVGCTELPRASRVRSFEALLLGVISPPAEAPLRGTALSARLPALQVERFERPAPPLRRSRLNRSRSRLLIEESPVRLLYSEYNGHASQPRTSDRREVERSIGKVNSSEPLSAAGCTGPLWTVSRARSEAENCSESFPRPPPQHVSAGRHCFGRHGMAPTADPEAGASCPQASCHQKPHP